MAYQGRRWVPKCWHVCQACFHCAYRGIRNASPCPQCGDSMTPVKGLIENLAGKVIAARAES
jgi:hypothetical protein